MRKVEFQRVRAAEPSPFPQGQRVTIEWNRSARGTVVRPGPDQSEVRWDGQSGTRVYVNDQLIRLVKRKR